MSEWPEPTRDPEEGPRWGGRIALAAAIGAILVIATNEDDLFGSFSLPEFSLPEFSMPELDLRGRAEEAPANLPITSSSDSPSLVPGASPIVQTVPYEVCLEMMADGLPGLAPPALIEDNAEQRVVRFKLLEGAITMTCSRADGTMTMDHSQ